MKKRVISFILVLAMAICFCPVVDLQASEPLPSYNIRNDYGADVFSYFARNVANGETTQMEWNDGHQMYLGASANYINRDWISTGVNPAVCSLIVFTAPYTGTVSITSSGITNHGYQWSATYADCYAQIVNTNWANLAYYSIPATDAQTVETPEVLVNVSAGDQIRFLIGSNSTLNSYLEWVPTIAYTSVTGGGHNHKWSSEWATNEEYHWHECSNVGCDIENNAEKDGYAEHTDDNHDLACDVCGAARTLSYNAYDDFGTDVFSYGTRNVANGEMGTMVTNADGSMYINGGNYISAAWISTGVDPAVCSVLTFTAPYAGTITINPNSIINRGAGWSNNYAESYAQIYHNSFANGIAAYNLPANDTPVVAEALVNIEVAAGDQIMFMVGSNSTLNSYVEWMPTVTYISMGEGTPSVEVTTEELLKPIWTGTKVYNESVMVLKNADGTIDPIQLMYPVESIDYVCDSSLQKIYQENIDYKIENGKLVILPSGSIPMTAYDEYYLQNEIPGNSFPAAQGGYLYFAEGSVFHEKQIAVTYSHSGTWQGGIPEGQAHKLPNTLEKLQNKEPLKIVFYGDSITVGANSSSFVQAEPYLPIWPELVTNALKTKYAYNDITAENTALGGAGIVWGADNVATLVAAKNPDLVFIGFGMNDNTDNNTYKRYISAMISAVRQSNPDCEFVLMGTMLPNSEVQQFASTNHINYVLALDEIARTGTGIAVADVTTVHSDLLNTKRYFDMTGNNVNHPNDFLARIYAQVAMQVFESASGGVHEHQWSLSWQFDKNFHWHECTADGCDIENNAEKDGYAEHTDVNLDLACDVCGAACALSYSAYDDFGTDVFSYGTRNVANGEMGTMVTNADGSMYINGGNYISAAWISTGVDPAVCSVLTFTAPYAGTITINPNSIINRGAGWSNNYAESYAQIYHNSFANGIAAYNLPANDTPVVAEALVNIEVAAGDQIMFMVGSNSTLNSYIEWVPTVEYTEATRNHNWAEDWTSDGTHHWHDCLDDCTITDNADKLGYGDHEDSTADGICDVCEAKIAGPKEGVYNFTHMFSNSQSGPWKYLTREGVTNVYKQLKWDNGIWIDGMGGMIAKDWMHASADASDKHEIQVCLDFVAPYDGKISLSMFGGSIDVGPDSMNGIRFAVWKNNDPITPFIDLKPGESYDFAQETVEVDKDDHIRFLLIAISGNNGGDSVVMLPIIKYTRIDYRLTPEQGFYSAMDMFSAGEQSEVWRYLKREAVSNVYSELTWDNGVWADGMGGIIAKDWMHASADASDKHEIQVCLQFVAPSDGQIELGMEDDVITVGSDSSNGVRVAITHNGTFIYGYSDLRAGGHYFKRMKLNITKGDTLNFLLIPISGNNAGDSCGFVPWIQYHSYEKAPEPELEVRPDDPSKTYYNATDDYGGYLNPWYYCYSTVGAQKLNAMSWGAQGGFFVPELPGLSISGTGAHPYPGYNAIRLFRVPKSGTIRITMNDGAISLPNGTSGAEDGVYVSVMLNDGSSVSEVFKRTLVLPGEVMKFEQIEMKIYEGWDLWFVVHCNTNNANDSVTFAPVIEYLEITDEKAPIISNRDETLTVPSLDELYGNGSDKFGDGLGWWIVIAFAATAVVANGVIFLVVAKGKKKQK